MGPFIASRMTNSWNSTHSFVDGHLDYFYLLALVNTTTIHVGLQIAIRDPALILLDIYPKVRLLNHMVVLFLSFSGNAILFSTVVVLRKGTRTGIRAGLPPTYCWSCGFRAPDLSSLEIASGLQLYSAPGPERQQSQADDSSSSCHD